MTPNDSTESASRWGGLIELQPQQLAQVAVLGFGIGIVAWIVAAFIGEVLLAPLFCGESSDGACATRGDLAGTVATLFAAVVGLLGLVKLGVYRPIIVVIASVICLWLLASWTAGLLWFESIAWYGLLYALLYALFTWLVRPRSLVIVLLVVIPVVVLIRTVGAL